MSHDLRISGRGARIYSDANGPSSVPRSFPRNFSKIKRQNPFGDVVPSGAASGRSGGLLARFPAASPLGRWRGESNLYAWWGPEPQGRHAQIFFRSELLIARRDNQTIKSPVKSSSLGTALPRSGDLFSARQQIQTDLAGLHLLKKSAGE
jgi:hypothetical protein